MATVGEWMTVEEAANWIGMPREVIELAARNKEIPALAIGGMVRIHRDTLLAMAGSSARGAPSSLPPTAEPAPMPETASPAIQVSQSLVSQHPTLIPAEARTPLPMAADQADNLLFSGASTTKPDANYRNGSGFVSRFGGRFR